MDNKNLCKFLATGEYDTLSSDVEDASLTVVSTAISDPFVDILAYLCAVEMLSNDYHYRCHGKAFYGEHLLADLIAEVGKESDDINEIHYMGECQMNPPFRADVAQRAIKVIDGIPAMANENGLIDALYDLTNSLVGLVERAKDTKPASGTTAVLDAISQKALQANGFLKRVMSGADMGFEKDSDTALTA